MPRPHPTAQTHAGLPTLAPLVSLCPHSTFPGTHSVDDVNHSIAGLQVSLDNRRAVGRAGEGHGVAINAHLPGWGGVGAVCKWGGVGEYG